MISLRKERFLTRLITTQIPFEKRTGEKKLASLNSKKEREENHPDEQRGFGTNMNQSRGRPRKGN